MLDAAPSTLPADINNTGQVVGIADLPDPHVHGFLLARGVRGPTTTIDVPGAAATFVFGLNDHREFVGTYTNHRHSRRHRPGPQSSRDQELRHSSSPGGEGGVQVRPAGQYPSPVPPPVPLPPLVNTATPMIASRAMTAITIHITVRRPLDIGITSSSVEPRRGGRHTWLLPGRAG